MQPINIDYLNIYETDVTAKASTKNNVAFFSKSHLKIVYFNNHYSLIKMPCDKRGKIFFITTYLETKSFKAISQ